jgi:hypothetical protein
MDYFSAARRRGQVGLPEGSTGELEAGGRTRLNAIAGDVILELLHTNIATIREEATMVVAVDKQKGRSGLSVMDTGELGVCSTRDVDGEILVQELHGEEGPRAGTVPCARAGIEEDERSMTTHVSEAPCIAGWDTNFA